MKCVFLLTLLFFNSNSFAAITAEKARSLVKTIQSVQSSGVTKKKSPSAVGSSGFGCIQAAFTFPTNESLMIVWDGNKQYKNGIKTEDDILFELETFWLQNRDEYGSEKWSSFIYGAIDKTLADDFDTLLAIFFISKFHVSSKSKAYQNIRKYFTSLGYSPADVDSLCASSSSDVKFVEWVDIFI